MRSANKSSRGVLSVKTMIRLFNDEDGATAIEYGLIAALISVAAIVAFRAVGTNLSGTFNAVSGNLS